MRYANCCGGWKRSSAVLIVLALFSTAHAAQFELPRESFLIDETIPIVISGLPPGEEVIIARGSRPVARLIPVGEVKGKRQPGSLKGQLRVGPEFLEPLPISELPT